MRIREMPASERPREKAGRLGMAALNDAELLAIFIRTGVPGRDALQVAASLLENCGGLLGLGRTDAREIRRKNPGIGEAKSLELAAAFEIGRRLARGGVVAPVMDAPDKIYQAFAQEMMTLRTEELRVLLLDTKLRLIRAETIALGSLNECVAHPREIFRPAIVHSSYAIVVLHNHPSGDPTPSGADRRLTASLREAASLLQIQLMDHIIFGTPADGRAPYFSFREAGLL